MRTLFYVLCIIPWWSCSQTTVPVYSDADSTIAVTAGQTFAVQLPSNIGTGYRWELREPPDTTLLSMTERTHRTSEKSDDNAGGHDYFQFHTHRKGAMQLRFWYVRPWKKDKSEDPATRQKNYTVSIR